MSEPTSTLDFEALIIEVAEKLGIAYYGPDGDEEAQAPTDAHDLGLCKKMVNNGIRMFIHDAPPNGWRWTRPVAGVVLWGTIDANSANTVTGVYDAGADETTFTAQTASFYESMELKTITVTTLGDLTISRYISSTHIVVAGSHAVTGKTWSMATDGNFTLPITFGGQHTGKITFQAGTNRGVTLSWVDESLIRERRSNVTQETGTPYEFAVRLMMTDSTPRRRWELMAYRMPGEVLTVQFPYTLAFNSLVNLTDTPPAPFAHDETIKAAVRAAAEKDRDDTLDGPDMKYYKESCLPNSYRVDNLSGPRRLGYFGNPSAAVSTASPIRSFRDDWYQRPAVPFNS